MLPNTLRCIIALGLFVAGYIDADADVVNQPKRLFGLGGLSTAAISSDKRHMATAGDSAAYLWDFESGTVRHRLPDHRTMVYALAFSPDSTRLVTGARFGSIGIWSVETGALIKLFRGHETDVNAISFAPDGKHFVSASSDNSAAVWSLETGELVRRVSVRGSPMNTAIFTPDGASIVTADISLTNSVRVWDIQSGSLIRVLSGHDGSVQSLAFLGNGTLASGGQDQTVRLWNLATGEVNTTFENVPGGVAYLVPIPNTSLLAAGSYDRRVIVYDWSTTNTLHTWSTETLSSLCWVPGTESLLTSSPDLLVRVLDLTSGQTQRALAGHTTSVTAGVGFSPDSQYVLSGGVEKATRLWNRTNSNLVRVFEGSGGGSASAVFSVDGRQVLTTMGFPRKAAQLWNAGTGQLERELLGHTDWLLAASFSLDGSRVATSSLDRTLRVWNASTGEQVRLFSAGNNFLYCVAFSPDGKLVAGGGSSFDPTVQVWDIETGATRGTFSENAGSVRALLFSHSGAELIVGWEDGLVRVIDLATGKIIQELFPSGFLSDIALSPDGEWLMFAEGWPSFAARIFEWRSGRELRVFAGHAAPVGAVAFNARGTQVLTGADVVRLWDVADLASRLSTKPKPGGLELTWNAGLLQWASSLDGPWSPVTNAVSPWFVSVEGSSTFFRVETQLED